MSATLVNHARNLSRFYDRAKNCHAITHLDRATYLKGCKPPGTSDRAWEKAVVKTVKPSDAIVTTRARDANAWNIIAQRWQKSKQHQGKLLAFNLWGKLRITASNPNSQALSLWVRASSWQWESAGVLYWRAEGWRYSPGKKSEAVARRVLIAILYEFLGIAIDLEGAS